MSSRLRMSASRPATIGCCLMLVCVGVACLCAGTAKASYYKAVLCAGNNGSNGFATATNTASANNPGGIFSFENYCGPAPYPAGSNAFLRIAENQSGGNAGYTAYGSMSWTAPPYVWIAAGGGYTREHYAFNAGWRGRFWLEGYDGSMNNVLMQGSGVENGSCGGVCWATTSTFASHLWPFGGYGAYRRFVFEMTCYRQAGCDRSQLQLGRREHDGPDAQRRRPLAHQPDQHRIGDAGGDVGPRDPARQLERLRPGLGDAFRASAGRRRRALFDRLARQLRPGGLGEQRRVRAPVPALPGRRAVGPQLRARHLDPDRRSAHGPGLLAGLRAGGRDQRQRRGKLRPADDPRRQPRPGSAGGSGDRQRQPAPLPGPLRGAVEPGGRCRVADHEGPLQDRQRRRDGGGSRADGLGDESDGARQHRRSEGGRGLPAARLARGRGRPLGSGGDGADPTRHDAAGRTSVAAGHGSQHGPLEQHGRPGLERHHRRRLTDHDGPLRDRQSGGPAGRLGSHGHGTGHRSPAEHPGARQQGRVQGPRVARRRRGQHGRASQRVAAAGHDAPGRATGPRGDCAVDAALGGRVRRALAQPHRQRLTDQRRALPSA